MDQLHTRNIGIMYCKYVLIKQSPLQAHRNSLELKKKNLTNYFLFCGFSKNLCTPFNFLYITLHSAGNGKQDKPQTQVLWGRRCMVSKWLQSNMLNKNYSAVSYKASTMWAIKKGQWFFSIWKRSETLPREIFLWVES